MSHEMMNLIPQSIGYILIGGIILWGLRNPNKL